MAAKYCPWRLKSKQMEISSQTIKYVSKLLFLNCVVSALGEEQSKLGHWRLVRTFVSIVALNAYCPNALGYNA